MSSEPADSPASDRGFSRGNYAWYVARRFVRARRQGFVSLISLLSAVGFLVGTASLILGLALMAGFQADMINKMLGANAHLLVFTASHHPIDDPETLLGQIEQVSGVVSAAPMLSEFAMVIPPSGRTEYANIFGIDPERAIRTSEIETYMRDGVSLEALNQPTSSGRQGIVLGFEMAQKLAVIPGDQVNLLVPQIRLTPWGASPRRPTFEVVGLFESNFMDYDQGWGFIHLDPARRNFGARGEEVDWISARIEDVAMLDKVQARVQAQLGAEYIVHTLAQENQAFFSALKLEKLMMFLAVGLIVLVAAVSVIITLLLMVTQKVRVIGVLIAMGASPSGILRIFIFQGAAVGIFGTLAGGLLGVSAAWVLDHYRVIALDGSVYFLDYVPFLVMRGDLIAVILVAIVVSILATLYPAWRAARLDPVEALRGE